MTAGMVFRARWRRGCCSAKLVFSRAARYLGGMALCALALGVQGGPVNRPQDDANPRTAQQWMERMQGASRSRSYVGTVVVLHASGAMATSKIWHAVRDGQQFERVDALGGEPLEPARLVARQVVGVDEAQRAEFPRIPLRGVWGAVAEVNKFTTAF